METIETNSEGATLHLSRYDLAIVANALDEICKAFQGDDLESRMGALTSEVQRLRDKFGQIYDGVVKN